jgi:hypothetical protein
MLQLTIHPLGNTSINMFSPAEYYASNGTQNGGKAEEKTSTLHVFELFLPV